MNKKYVVFYISSHGFGYMTRCLAIMKKILETTNYSIYIACEKKHNEFAKIYLKNYSNRAIYKNMATDIGLVNKDKSLRIDKQKLEKKLKCFICSWSDIVDKEVNYLSRLNIEKVITDISPVGCLVASKLNKELVGISNFTWVEQYEYLNLEPYIIDKFKEAYSYIDTFIEYKLSLDMKHSCKVHKANMVCREIDYKNVDRIKEDYGKSIFITCGKSAYLDIIQVKNFKGTIFTTSGIDIVSDEDINIVELPINILNTHEYIAASDIVISKAGWTTICESIVCHRNLVLVDREEVLEDSHSINELKKENIAISVKEKDLRLLDIKEVEEKLKEKINIDNLSKYRNDLDNLIKLLDL